MNKEIEIPDGYEAIIEGNKVIIKQKESEDDRIRKALTDYFVRRKSEGDIDETWYGIPYDTIIAFLEKQKEQKSIEDVVKDITKNKETATKFLKSAGIMDDNGELAEMYRSEQKPTEKQDYSGLNDLEQAIFRGFLCAGVDNAPVTIIKETAQECLTLIEQKSEMIQWTGNNLKEVIDFTGKSPRFGEWFNSWEEFEQYVHAHNDILKLFCEDGSHYEVPVGAWIVKTPDGFNIPSLFRFVQKSTESNSIKGGDFISDGKRVFLVLANVEERNFGETGSTFCESLILGVDGVVYCNGDDFKKYKRATSDERAKFIHDLKVRVKLKEQPAEWSEDIRNWKNIAYYVLKEWLGIGQYLDNPALDKIAEELQKRYGSVNPESIPQWSKEDEKMLASFLHKVEVCDLLTNKENVWIVKRLKSLRPQPKVELTLLDENIINAAVAFIEQNDHFNCWRGIDKHTVIKALRCLKPHWKPSEQEKGALRTAISILTDERNFPKTAAQLQNILDAFERKEPRKDWKPSKEQMDALETGIENTQHLAATHFLLVSLSEELKKL